MIAALWVAFVLLIVIIIGAYWGMKQGDELDRLYLKYPDEKPKKVKKEKKLSPLTKQRQAIAKIEAETKKIEEDIKALSVASSKKYTAAPYVSSTLPPLRKGPSVPGHAVADGYKRMEEVYGPNFIGPAAVVEPEPVVVDPFADEEWDAVVESSDAETDTDTEVSGWDSAVDAIYNAPEVKTEPEDHEIAGAVNMANTLKLVGKLFGEDEKIIKSVRNYYVNERENILGGHTEWLEDPLAVVTFDSSTDEMTYRHIGNNITYTLDPVAMTVSYATGSSSGVAPFYAGK